MYKIKWESQVILLYVPGVKKCNNTIIWQTEMECAYI